ncbi:MAG TPA: c-type cytochrome biogenesis protein CcmI [Burkholderiales bacterium]|nr:c-type cytochrome biogenesis protein CcmI [Burkholderiales bacterium]
MTLFVVLGVLLVAGALLFIVPPLARRTARAGASRDAVNVAVYRDQLRELDADLKAGTLAPDQHDKARAEIEARLAADLGKSETAADTPGNARGAALALGLAVPICALAVYLSVGNPRALSPEAQAGAGPHGMTAQQFETMVERLAARMKENPEDTEGWMMLGRSYAVMGRFPESSEAYAKAVARAPKDAQLLADYADSLAMAQGRTLKGEPEKILKRALAADPNNVKALVLAGTAAFDRGDKAGAVQLWERALVVVPAESQMAERLRAGIAEARGSSAIAQAPKAAKAAPKGAPKGARVSGTVKVDPKLAGKIAPDDTVFIFARAAEGPRMPLAILRRQGRDLPLQFTLDDSMAMAPQMNLSAFPRVVIGARVSKSANASAQPGDLQGASAPIAVGSERIDVTIDTEVR